MADIFDVIADSTRREILHLLLERSDAPSYQGTSVSQIVGDLGVSQPTVSKHLKVLREAGLVSVREEGQHRFYSLDSRPMDDIEDWLMPFLDAQEINAPVVLNDSAAHAAELVGRAAASVSHAIGGVFGKGRRK